jgi:hypothetical protein
MGSCNRIILRIESPPVRTHKPYSGLTDACTQLVLTLPLPGDLAEPGQNVGQLSPLGLAGSVYVAGALLAMTGIASALTDIPLIAHVQSRVPDRHLAKALGVWEAGITGAVAPSLAAFAIARVGLTTGFMLSGSALIALGLGAAMLLARTDRAVPARTTAS